MNKGESTKNQKSKWQMILAFGLGCVITLCITLFAVFFLSKPNVKAETLPMMFVEYGDSFTELSVIDSKGNSQMFPAIQNDYAIVASLSAGCTTCFEELDAVGELIAICSGDFADIILLWQSEKPWDILKKKQIPDALNYSCDSQLLANGIPHFYLLDKNANVIFACERVSELVQKLLSLDEISVSELQAAADQYLFARFGKSADAKKPTLIEFSMVGCKDCIAVEPILQGTRLQQTFHQTTVYCDTAGAQDEHAKEVDYGNMIAQIHGIRWYPSFIVYHETERTVIGETALEQLENTLLQTMAEK